MELISSMGFILIGWLIMTQSAYSATVYPLGMVSSTGANSTSPDGWGRGYSFSVTTDDVWVADLAWNTPSESQWPGSRS